MPDNNDNLVLPINFLYQEAKQNQLADETSRILQFKLKGVVAKQYTKINQKTKSTCGNNHEKIIKDSEKEITDFKLVLANTNQLISNLCNKTSTYFLQESTFPLNPTNKCRKNIDFAIKVPP